MNSETAKPAGSNRILVVDDEQFVIAALREALRHEGYEIVSATDPVDALQLVRQQPFAVFLVDQQMASLTGLEFLTEAKSIQPDATRILITAVLNLSTVIDAINKGEVYRFIVKPWLREELLVTLKNAVQRFELIRTNAALQLETRDANQRLAEQLAVAADTGRRLEALNEALKKNLLHSIELCLQLVDAFHPTLGYQARQVRELCRAMAASLALSADDCEVLFLSASLHNLGLLSVPRQMIRKWQKDPLSLLDAERVVLEQYPSIGAELAGFTDQLQPVARTIRFHREWWDGNGYPDHLSGNDIPWLSRLLGVAVAYATCPLKGEAAADHVRDLSGVAFDPEAVRAFLRALPQAVILPGQQEVLLSELQPGMVLAKGIYTGTGLLLIPAGQVLNGSLIEKLRSHHQGSPILQSLVVYC